MEQFGLRAPEAHGWIADESDLLELPVAAIVDLILDHARRG